jgi:dephospho-CoA kinase
MTNTETIELQTDTVEQLVELLQYDLLTTNPPMNRDRREAVAEQLQSEIDRPDAIALCGLPGAGKSYVAEKLGKVYDTQAVSMGGAIRSNAPKRVLHQSGDLGNYAAEVRKDDARTIPEWVVELVNDDADLVIIDGVRSMIDEEVLSDYFDTLHLIEVKAKFYTRLERITERGREGEEHFTAADLGRRDDHERQELGFGPLKRDERIDLELYNGEGGLELELSELVENKLPYDIENGQPLGLDEDLEDLRQHIAARSQ